jgi:hypothetical protein
MMQILINHLGHSGAEKHPCIALYNARLGFGQCDNVAWYNYLVLLRWQSRSAG